MTPNVGILPRKAACWGVMNNRPRSGIQKDGSLPGLGRPEKHVGGCGESRVGVPLCRLSPEIPFEGE